VTPPGPIEVIGHYDVRALLRTVRAPSLAFVGPASVGRLAVARWWAAWLNCESPGDDPCGRCASCSAAALDAHPDLMVKGPPATTKSGRSSLRPVLRIDQMVPRGGATADPEPLARFLETRPRFTRRVGIVDDADTLGEGAANAFLKVLEEPPSWATIVLIAPSPGALLPTVASRCLVVRFGAAPTEGYADLAPHPALRSGQLGRLRSARDDPASEKELRSATVRLVAALNGPLDEAFAAGEAWVALWTSHASLAPGERLLEQLRSDAPHRYPSALDAVREAEDALRAYATASVVAHALTLRLRGHRFEGRSSSSAGTASR